MNHKLVILLIYLLLQSIQFAPIGNSEISTTTENTTPGIVLSESISLDSIVITSDSDFISNGFTGSGSYADPYVLEGSEITSGNTIIDIKNTNAFFEIRNCIFTLDNTVTSYNFVIELNQITYGKLINNTVISEYGGIHIDSDVSKSIELTNNSIDFGYNHGIDIDYYTSNLHIANNTVVSTGGSTALSMTYGSANFTIENNYLSGKLYGLRMDGMENVTIKSNEINGNRKDALFSSNTNITVKNNSFQNTGIQVNIQTPFLYNFTNNKVRDKFLLVLINQTSQIIDFTNVSQILILESDDIVIEDLILSEVAHPIVIYNSTNVQIRNVTILLPDTSKGLDITVVTSIGINVNYGSNFTLANSTITGYPQNNGISVNSMNSLFIENNTITNLKGIFARSCTEVSIKNNNISSSIYLPGISLIDSVSKVISNNILVNSSFEISGNERVNYLIGEFSNNYINNKLVLYLKNVDNVIIGNDISQLFLYNVSNILISKSIFLNIEMAITIVEGTNITIRDVIMSNIGYPALSISDASQIRLQNVTITNDVYTDAIRLSNCTYIELINNYFYNTRIVDIEDSNNITISNNTFKYSSIHFYDSDNILIEYNSLNFGYGAIQIKYAENVSIFKNNISKVRSDGLYLYSCQPCRISENIILDSQGYGIYVDRSTTNIEKNNIINSTDYGLFVNIAAGGNISLNNFIDNNNGQVQAYDDTNGCYYYNNFWSDQNSTDNNNDGIFDDPYYLDGGKSVADSSPLVVATFDLNIILLSPVPEGGYLSGVIDITWSPQFDFLGHEVVYELLFSVDDGKNWISLDKDNIQNEFQWDTQNIDNTLTLKFKLIATYNGMQKEFISRVYEIQNTPVTSSNTLPSTNTDTPQPPKGTSKRFLYSSFMNFLFILPLISIILKLSRIKYRSKNY